MFDNLESKKSDEVDDIFADTDTISEKKDEEINKLSSSEPTEEPNKKIASEEPEIVPEEETREEEEVKEEKTKNINIDRTWFKPVIIGGIIIIGLIGIYFLFSSPSADDDELSSPLISSEPEEDDFVPSSPELIDPSLIIPDPIIEEEFEEEEFEEEEFEEEEPEEEEFEEEEPEEEEFEEEELEEEFTINLLDTVFVDSDGDGLSDLAEIFIGTDPYNPDTDGDGYSDYEEMINGYNPLGDGILTDNFPAIMYQSNDLSFFYPRNWQLDTSKNNVWLLIAPDDASIEIRREWTNYLNVFNWYQDKYNDSSWIGKDRQIVNKEMGPAIIDSEGNTIFIISAESSRLFSINLGISDNNDFEYFKELALLVNTLIQR